MVCLPRLSSYSLRVSWAGTRQDENFARQRTGGHSQARIQVGPQSRGVRGLGCLRGEGLGDGLLSSCPPPGPSVAAGAEDPGVAARALACVADVLGCMAEGRGGLRSGPAANPEWVSPFSFLERGDLARGVEGLTRERARWLSR